MDLTSAPRALLRDLRRNRPVWIVGALGLVISLLVFEGVRRWERRVARQEFAWTAQAEQQAIQAEVRRILGAVDAVGRFAGASKFVSPAEFDHFASAFLSDGAPLVALALAAADATQAGSGSIGAPCAPASGGPPAAGSRGWRGPYRLALAPGSPELDGGRLAAHRAVRRAMADAHRAGALRVTPPFHLAEGASAPGYAALVRPVPGPEREGAASDPGARRSGCLVLGLVELGEEILAAPGLPSAAAPIWTEWSHREADGTRHRLVSELPRSIRSAPRASLLRKTARIPVGEGTLEIRSLSSLPLWAAPGWMQGTVLLAGVALTGLAGLSLRLAVARRERDLASSRAQMARVHAGLDQQRQLLDGVLRNVLDGILTFDAKGIVESFNPAAERIFGLPAEAVVGGAIERLFASPGSEAGAPSGAAEARRAPGPLIGTGLHEIQGRRGNGSTFPLEIGISEMRVGGERRFIACFRDVSERREDEQKLRQALRVEAVGQLTGGVAHDFNNLLTIILGNLELLERRCGDDPRLASRLAASLRAAERGAELTQRLLAFARRQPLEPTTVDANELVVSTLDLVKRALPDSIQVETNLADDLWKTQVDPAQLENSIVNLAVNARDAMPDGGLLRIETANARLSPSYAERNVEVEAGDYVMVAITDTGCGMPPEVRASAFEPYFTTKETGKGTGLGLSMVHGFVKQSRGHVQIYSEPGHGTTIRLYFPRFRGADAEERGAGSEGGARGGTERILLVEDESGVRAVAAEELRELGYEVLEARDGPDALRVLEAEEPLDLLFTDVVMPGGLSGLELAEKVLAARPGVRVLFTSGYTERAAFGAEAFPRSEPFLVKPYTREDLARAVRAALEGR